MKSYIRVFPRDLFNEAKLLKCMGRLTLAIHEDERCLKDFLRVDDLVENKGFDIKQNISGDITLTNVYILHKESNCYVWFHTPLNSKANYPLVFIDREGEHINVFEEDGSLTETFILTMEKYQ